MSDVLCSVQRGGTPAGKTTLLYSSDERAPVAEASFGKVEQRFDFVVLAFHGTCFYEAECTLHSQDRVAELMNHVGGAYALGIHA